MKKTKYLVIPILISTILTGCGSVDYKRYGDGIAYNVGYSDFEISPNKYKVTYTGDAFSNIQEVMRNTYRRAKELCFEKGFKEYITSNPNNETETQKIGSGNLLSPGNIQLRIYSLDVECK